MSKPVNDIKLLKLLKRAYREIDSFGSEHVEDRLGYFQTKAAIITVIRFWSSQEEFDVWATKEGVL